MNIHDTNITVYIVSCCECDKVWRSAVMMWCPRCGEAEGIRLRICPERGVQMMQAIHVFDEENGDDMASIVSAMQVHCPWYDNNSPQHVQASWAYLRDQHPTAAIQRVMEIFETRFQTAIFNLDENGERYANNQEPIHMG